MVLHAGDFGIWPREHGGGTGLLERYYNWNNPHAIGTVVEIAGDLMDRGPP